MIKINILSRSDQLFYAQWDKEKYPESKYRIEYNSTEDVVWDCVVVYQNIKVPYTFKCKSGRVIYFSGEPPLMEPCPNVFTSQFDTVVLPHPDVRHPHKILSHGFLNWSLGFGFFSKTHRYNYSQLSNLKPEKEKLISVVSSNQRMMPGHNKRMAIIDRLQKDYAGLIDVFGKGFESVDFKADVLNPYLFHICIENTSMPHYWTEKIADPILSQSVPIYSGCTNIDDYFGGKGYFKFDVDSYDSLKLILDKIIENPLNIYSEMKANLEDAKKKLMEEYNIIPFLINFSTTDNTNSTLKEYHITPLDQSFQYKMQMYLIRLKRLALKKYFEIINHGK